MSESLSERITRQIGEQGYAVVNGPESIADLEATCQAGNWVAHYAVEHQGYKVIPNLNVKPEPSEPVKPEIPLKTDGGEHVHAPVPAGAKKQAK